MWNRPLFACRISFALLLLAGIGLCLFGYFVTPMWTDALSVAFKNRDGQWRDEANQKSVQHALTISSIVAGRYLILSGCIVTFISTIGMWASLRVTNSSPT